LTITRYLRVLSLRSKAEVWHKLANNRHRRLSFGAGHPHNMLN
jgi:hypothetical protein